MKKKYIVFETLLMSKNFFEMLFLSKHDQFDKSTYFNKKYETKKQYRLIKKKKKKICCSY